MARRLSKVFIGRVLQYVSIGFPFMVATTLRLDISVDGSRQVSWCHRIWCRGTWRGEGLLDTVQVASFEIRGGNSRNPSGWPPFSVHPSQGDFRHLSCQERSVEDDNSVRASSLRTFPPIGEFGSPSEKGDFYHRLKGGAAFFYKTREVLRRVYASIHWQFFSKQPFFQGKVRNWGWFGRKFPAFILTGTSRVACWTSKGRSGWGWSCCRLNDSFRCF